MPSSENEKELTASENKVQYSARKTVVTKLKSSEVQNE